MPETWETKHRSDPKRWERRHHYQAGPGFLFLATQGGRPSESVPSVSQLDQVRRRMRAVRLASQEGVTRACRRLGCSPRSVRSAPA